MLLASMPFQGDSDLLQAENEERTVLVPHGQHHLCSVQAQFIDGEAETTIEPSSVLVTVKTDRKGRWRSGP